VVGDEDGVVVLPVQQAPWIVDESVAREAKEAQIIERLLAGERTLEAYNFK
jgi:regulator of RNase E activity RraA